MSIILTKNKNVIRKKCKKCGNEVEADASNCPHCGRRAPRVGFAEVLISILFFAVCAYFIFDWWQERKIARQQAAEATQQQIKESENKPTKTQPTTVRGVQIEELRKIVKTFPQKYFDNRIYEFNFPLCKYNNVAGFWFVYCEHPELDSKVYDTGGEIGGVYHVDFDRDNKPIFYAVNDEALLHAQKMGLQISKTKQNFSLIKIVQSFY